MEDNTATIICITVVIIGMIIAGAGISFGIYKHKELATNNFQATIDNLSDEQKCLHICGFNFPSSAYYDNYKFCVEKCDRISERVSARGP